MDLKVLDKHTKETALRRFNKHKKQFEKETVSVILRTVGIFEKNMFEKYGRKITDIERDTAIRDFYKGLIEKIGKKKGLSPRDAKIMPTENMYAYLLDDLVAERIYEKIKKRLPKYMKRLRVELEEEQLKKVHKTQEKREETGKIILDMAKDIAISFGQFRMGLYRDHIYDNMLWWVGNLRDTVKSLAEIDLSTPEYKEVLSFKNFNVEKFLITPGSIQIPIHDRKGYSEDGFTHHLQDLRLGMFWENTNSYKIPKKHRKEEYLCALELVNRIKEEAKELIKDYAPGISKKIIEIRLPQEPKPIVLKCIECEWETTENISLCEVCGGKLKKRGKTG